MVSIVVDVISGVYCDMSTIGVAVGSGVFVLEMSTSVGLSAGASVAVFVVDTGELQELIIKTIQSNIRL